MVHPIRRSPRSAPVRLAPLAAALLLAIPIAAQAADGAALADSAAAARSAWRDARRSLAQGDTTGAAAFAARAHASWPAQWYYAYAAASLAAASRDPAGTARALRDLAAIGAGPDLDREPEFAALAATPAGAAAGLPAALDRVREQRTAIAASTVAFAFAPADSDFFPEGIAVAPRTGRVFVASVRHRKVAVVEPGAAPRDFVRASDGGLPAALAVAVDEERGLLWVTGAGLPVMDGYTAADSGRGVVGAFDLATGRLRATHELPPAPEGHVPGDVCVAGDGSVYVSDSAHPAVYRVRGDSLVEFATDPAFRSLQGQALSPDGRTLYVADYAHGIAAIDLATATTTWLDPPPTGSVLGVDGMARHGEDLVAVQNGIVPPRVIRIRLARDGTGGAATRIAGVETLDRRVPIADEPTIGVVAGDDFLYVADSLWEKFDDGGARRPGTALRPPVILRLPLRPRR